MSRLKKPFIFWRRGSESNRRIKVLQTLVSRLQGLSFQRAFSATHDLARLWPGCLSLAATPPEARMTAAPTDAQLIALAAERILGWRVYTSGRGSTIAEDADCNEHVLATTHPWEQVTFDPLTDDRHAFMLVDAMASEFMFRLGSHPWVARFFSPSGDEFDAVAANRRRAILLACLRAKNVDPAAPSRGKDENA